MHDDLEDEGWVTCLLCARSFPARDVLAVQRAERLQPAAPIELPKAS